MKNALLTLALLTGAYFSSTAQSVLYVDVDATGANDGTSWSDAFTSLDTALQHNISLGANIWIAEGVYHPKSQTEPFTIDHAENLYGGFNGTETALNQRDPKSHITVLSGDLLQNDDPADYTTFSDNAEHVVEVETDPIDGDGDEIIIIDGLTISDGYNNGSGAGFVTVGYGQEQRGFHFNNCVFENNIANDRAAILCYSTHEYADFRLTNTVFRNNRQLQYYTIEFRLIGQLQGSTYSAYVANNLFESNSVRSANTNVNAVLGRFTNLSAAQFDVYLMNNTVVSNSIPFAPVLNKSLFAYEIGNTLGDIVVHAYNNLFYDNHDITLFATNNSNFGTGFIVSNTNANGGDFAGLSGMNGSIEDTVSPFVDFVGGDYRPVRSFTDQGDTSAYKNLALPLVDLNGEDRFDTDGKIAIGALQPDPASNIGLVERQNTLRVYPNPASNYIVVAADEQLVTLRLLDLQGRLIKEVHPNGSSNARLSIETLSSGTYLLQAFTGSGVRNSTIVKR